MLENALFLKKKTGKIAAASPQTPVGLQRLGAPPPDPYVVGPP